MPKYFIIFFAPLYVRESIFASFKSIEGLDSGPALPTFQYWATVEVMGFMHLPDEGSTVPGEHLGEVTMMLRSKLLLKSFQEM